MKKLTKRQLEASIAELKDKYERQNAKLDRLFEKWWAETKTLDSYKARTIAHKRLDKIGEQIDWLIQELESRRSQPKCRSRK